MRWSLIGALLLSLFISACGTTSPNRTSAPKNPAAVGVPAQESAKQEAARIRAQRDQSSTNGVVVYSAGSIGQVGWYKMQVQPVGHRARSRWLSVSTNCGTECLRRKLTIRKARGVVQHTLSVVNLEPGQWRMSAVQFGRRKQVLKNPITFDVRKGYATYLGGFAIQVINQLNVYRYSALQSDLSRALSQYPQTRGRRMINTAKKLRKPTLMR